MDDTTKYVEIAEEIRKKIITNVFKSNELLPSEKDLCMEYGVSRRTVRRAINALVESGYAYTVPGKGTFVHILNKDCYNVKFDLNDIIFRGFNKSELYKATILSPDVYLVYNLQVSPVDKVLQIQSLLKRDDEIVAFDIKNMPYFLGIPIKEENLNYTNLRDVLKSKISQYEMKEEIFLSSEMSDPELMEKMQLEVPQPLMVLDIIISDANKVPLGWNKIYIKGSEFEIKGVSI